MPRSAKRGLRRFPIMDRLGLTDPELRSTAVNVNDDRVDGGKIAVTASVTAIGDTTIYTPAAGKGIRLFWISAMNRPSETDAPLIKVKIGSNEYYRVYATAHWEKFEGAADESLIINLDLAGDVAVTAHITEFTP